MPFHLTELLFTWATFFFLSSFFHFFFFFFFFFQFNFLGIKDEEGQAAVKTLQDDGLSPKLHQLDVTDIDSVNALKHSLLSNNGGLDILVNNAGIMYKVNP